MPIAITQLSAANVAKDTAAAGSASNANSAGDAGDPGASPALAGFAALLVGQKLAPAPAGTGKADAGGSGDAATAGKNDSASPVDPAQMLAELGFATVPAQPVPTAATPAAGTAGNGGAASAKGDGAGALSAAALAALTARGDAATGKGGANAATPANADAAAPHPGTNDKTQTGALADSATPALAPATAGSGNAVHAAAAAGETAKVAGFGTHLETAMQNAETRPQGEMTPSPVAAQPQATPAHTPASESLNVATPVRDPAWASELGQKVVWLASQDKQSAQITLNPPQLGPIEISLNLKNDQATAVFTSPHAEVRNAIENALPSLREALAGVGVQLGQADVNSQSFRQPATEQQQQQQQNRPSYGAGGDAGAGAATSRMAGVSSGTATLRRGNGLVDTFA